MAQATLNGQVVLLGRVDNSFGALGQAMIGLGMQLNRMTQQLVDFAKESVEVYTTYEDNMLAAQTALARQYGFGTREIRRVMDELDSYAREWAANSIYHADDVSAAINNVSHAGWDLEQIIYGVPAAMKLAQAGAIDLTQSTDYIVKSTNAAGVAFADLDDFVDQWVYAANSSVGDVESFGEAMVKMGGTMKFADSTEELFTLLAALHDAGATGANAGTLLRNTMIRLVAPTTKASKAMELLGVQEDEWDEALGDQSGQLDSAAKSLEKYGFSAYDSQGDLKSFTEIFTDLNKAMGLMETEEERNNVIASIFPTRTITGALNLLDAAAKSYGGLYDEMLGGAHTGYAGSAADLMMSGYTGALETLNSKLEETKLVVGENLEGDVISVAGNLGTILEHINALGQEDNGVSAGLGWLEKLTGWVADLTEPLATMDGTLLDMVTEGIGALAGEASALIAGGMLMKTMGWLFGTKAGLVALAAAGVAAYAALEKLNEVKYNEMFGDMDLDTTELDAALERERANFNAVWQETETLRTSLNGLSDTYKQTSADLASDLLMAAVTGKQLTDEDEQAIYEYAGQINKTMKEAIATSGDYDAAFWTALFSYNADGTTDSAGDVAQNPIYQWVIDELNRGQTDLTDRATQVGQAFNKALSDAMSDHVITEEERASLIQYFQEYNDLMAEAEQMAANEAQFTQRQKMFKKAQSLSWSEFAAYANDTMVPQRDQELATINDNFDTALFSLQYRYEQGRLYGDDGQLITEAEYLEKMAAIERERQEALAGVYRSYDDLLLGMSDAMIEESDMNKMDDKQKELLNAIITGQITQIEAAAIASDYGIKNKSLLEWLFYVPDRKGDSYGKYLSNMINLLGGADAIQARIDQYRDAGLTDEADRLQELINRKAFFDTTDNYSSYAYTLSDVYAGLSRDELYQRAQTMDALGQSQFLAFWNMIQSGKYDETNARYIIKNQDSDLNKAFMTAIADALFSEADAQMQYPINFGVGQWYSNTLKDRFAEDVDTEDMPTPAYVGWENENAQAGMGGVEVSVAFPDAQENASAANTQIHEEIKPVDVPVNFVQGGGASIYAGAGGATHTGVFQKELGFFASGGRADTASIFGEAGPEWAIPEEHTENTAALLAQAAAASGFEWGSLSDAQSGGSITIEYAPVIHADNAQGVDDALRLDKERFKKILRDALEERELIADMGAYDVR